MPQHWDIDGKTPIRITPANQYSYIAAASANQDSQLVNAGKCRVYTISLHNNAAAERYVRIYDKATAPTSADTPIRRHSLAASGGGIALSIPYGSEFSNGLAFRITTGSADTDATAATAGDVFVNFDWNPTT